MIKLAEVSLESEMDIILCSQKFLKITEILHLSLSTKSTFASAISEVARVMTDHTDNGILSVGINEDKGKFKLICEVTYPGLESTIDPELFHFAKRLVPVFDVYLINDRHVIQFSIGLPKSLHLDKSKIQLVVAYIENSLPVSPYETLKISKNELSQKAELQEEELKAAKILNDLKSEFISIASHELKSPLTILKAYGDIAVSSKMKSLAQVQEYVRRMNAQCSKLAALALQLLDSAKIEIGNLEYEMTSLDFNAYLLRTLEDLKHLTPEHNLVTELCNSCMMTIDELRLEQVIVNLVSNAAKYSEKGTNIYIQTTRDPAENTLKIMIRDEGIGISESGIKKIFDKFYREPAVIGKLSGLGIGMYIASKIVSSHGGQIWVTSELGKGSTFHVSLPIN
ncbi:HAMP domain-containing histidine kinase [Pedobacter sp. MC2016-14]|uniref:sensor histidine kinase n=1 Tax=Pedobacter sp. MC2016-14 TaxID=2897327 RepID=UPI001E40EE7D|nr:HAMP domain-containing sensor histidine kinase [Pedobacter sp. MC2016-14]MCD0488177.1 HAMP domain-containing histidine kinase [Pedobacter sp. MC2016-14]